ncbi:MAG TPA: precorrin-4 C(11)-methyltransferase [Candidatus Dormibacteraeota bacterium]|nr:precorrin-4 C(11)-methyltransferase [Candidatus Dormibacteraeota bacterium]
MSQGSPGQRPVLYGVGVGPGDPELLTLKAARLIREADVIFCPRGAQGRPGRARRAAAAHLQGRRVVELDLEVRGDRGHALDRAAAIVLKHLKGGIGVYLTEGDPSLYSTFHHLRSALLRLAPQMEVVAVPGVSAFTAVAAATGMPLATGTDTVAIVPASAPAALIKDALTIFDRTVVLKPSTRPELGSWLDELGLLEGSRLVVEATGPGQEIRGGVEAASRPAPYFSAWLVPGAPGRRDRGRVHFVGAGPGAASLLTRRALSLLRHADLVVAADSLVTPEVIELARPGATVLRSAGMTLEEIVPALVEGARAGQVVVRLHSGDPSIYGAIAEQMAGLRAAGCAYEVVPGVGAAGAVAAALGIELTEPGGAQTVILTRHGRRVPVPASERLRALAATRATLVIYLSAASAAQVQAELLAGGLPPETPAAVAYRVSWPDQLVAHTTLGQLSAEVRRLGLRRHTLILVGEALRPGLRRSRLYDPGHAHRHRPRVPASAPSLPTPPALVVLTAPGLRLARRLARAMDGARLVAPAHLATDVEPLGSASERLPQLFAAGTPLVMIMALGAAVRLLAPALRDKRREPPVVVVDDAGRYAISLVGGRAAGANRLAEWAAAVLGAEAVVTTAAERLGLPTLEDLVSRWGWQLETVNRPAVLEAALVNGEPIGLFAPGLEPPAGLETHRVLALEEPGLPRAGLAVTDRVLDQLPEGWALLRPRRLRLGLGCTSAANAVEATEAALSVLAEAGLSPAGVGKVATIDRRARHPAVVAVAERLRVEVVSFSPEELARIAVPSASEAVRRAVGTPSVAEAAVIAAGARLLVPKRIQGRVTVAVGEAGP